MKVLVCKSVTNSRSLVCFFFLQDVRHQGLVPFWSQIDDLHAAADHTSKATGAQLVVFLLLLLVLALLSLSLKVTQTVKRHRE